MPLLNSATAIKLGSTPVESVYRGGVLVWPPGTGNRLNASLELLSGSTVRLTVSWAGETPTSYKIWTSLNGGAWVFWTEQTDPGWHDYATTYSTNIKMKVEAYYSGFAPDIQTYTNEVAIGAAPPPPTEQKLIHLTATRSASYNGSNANRNVAECYYGYYSSTNGQQKSLWCFDIPEDLRNCISIDRLDVAIYNVHHYLNSGGRAGLVVHHGNYNAGFPTTYPGSTGIIVDGAGNIPVWPAPKPGWYGTPLEGGAWLNVTDWITPGRATVKEEFRIHGAWGFGFHGSGTSQSWYGYAAGAVQTNPPQMRVWYTVYT